MTSIAHCIPLTPVQYVIDAQFTLCSIPYFSLRIYFFERPFLFIHNENELVACEILKRKTQFNWFIFRVDYILK